MINIKKTKLILDNNAPLSAEILLNASMILTTIENTVPFDRGFGIDPAIIDMPPNEARDFYMVECTTKLRIFEPRAIVKSVSFTADQNGSFYPRVVLTVES